MRAFPPGAVRRTPSLQNAKQKEAPRPLFVASRPASGPDIPRPEVLELLIEPQIALMAALGDLPRPDRLQHRAALLPGVGAVRKAAPPQVLPELHERLRKHCR